MSIESLGPLVAGPASAVFCLIFMLAGLYKITVDKLLPMLGAALDRHLRSLDELVATNSRDHRAMIETLQRIDIRLSERDDPPRSAANG